MKKPNVLLVHPPHIRGAEKIDLIAEKLSGLAFVYLLRPMSGFREDSAAGVRFLNNSMMRLPDFGHLDLVVTIGESEILGALREAYPHAVHRFWIEAACEKELSSLEHLLTRDRVIRVDFGPGIERGVAAPVEPSS